MGAQASHEPLEQSVARDQPHPTNHVIQPEVPPGSFTRRLSIRKSRKKRKAERLEAGGGGGGGGGPSESEEQRHHRRMDRLRRSLRDSFRRRKEPRGPESSRPHQWQADEAAVRAGTCSFHVKYLGCVQVYESRGMQVCEDALKLVRSQRRRPLRGILYVSGDGLRVVDDETKDLIVDQTIEKVSFCAPDRNHERGFSYICRDGTTRRWMCHTFLAIRESGDRLSHAVGCAFAACLERKQKRDKECSVTMAVDPATSSFTRFGSFRQGTITDRLNDPQEGKPAEPVPVMPVSNPYAVERPHAPVGMFERQGSVRLQGRLSEASPFKRQYSLRLNELPSTLERQGRALPSRENTPRVAPIPEVPAVDEEEEDTNNVTLLCRELSSGLNVTNNPPQGLNMTNGPPQTSQQQTRPAVADVTVPARPDDWLSSLSNGGGPAAGRPGSGSGSGSGSGPGSTPEPEWHGPAAPADSWRSDPFDSEWAQIAERNNQANKATNPFIGGGSITGGAVKTFEVHM